MTTGTKRPKGWAGYRRLPMRGIWFAGALRETGGRLGQTAHWAFYAAGLAAVAGLAVAAWFAVLLSRGSGPPQAEAMATWCALGGVLLLAVYAALAGRWELDRAAGRCRLRPGGWPLGHTWPVPLAEVRAVLVLTYRRESGEPSEESWTDIESVGLQLSDDPDPRRVLFLVHRRRRRARETARRIGRWLGVKVLRAPAGRQGAPSAEAVVELPAKAEDAAADAGLPGGGPARTIGVSGAPAGGDSASSSANLRLEHSADGQVLRMIVGIGGRLLPWVFFAGGVATVAVAAAAMAADWRARLVILAAGLFGCGLGALLWRGFGRFEFDRRGGLLRYRSALGRPWRKVRLAEIAAVQTCHGGHVSFSEGPGFDVHELNVVLADAQRINVSRHGDVAATRRHGRQLAEFLDVPWLDMAATGSRELHLLAPPTPLDKAETGPPAADSSPRADAPDDAESAVLAGPADSGAGGPLPEAPIGGGSTSFRSTRLLCRGAGARWLIVPSVGMRVFSGVFMCMGVGLMAGGVWLVPSPWLWFRILVTGMLCLFGLLFLVAGGLMFASPQRWRFDGDRRVVRLRRHMGAAPEQWAFDAVRAIQVLEAARAGGGPGAGYRVFEMNLVLPDGTRRNITRHAAGEWTRQTAAILADFLGVPRIDHTDADAADRSQGRL